MGRCRGRLTRHWLQFIGAAREIHNMILDDRARSSWLIVSEGWAMDDAAHVGEIR